MKRSDLKKLTTYTPSQDSSKLVKIGEASKLLGVSIDTLRRWEKKGWLKAVKTPGGTRLYDKEQLVKLNPNLKRGPKTFISPVVKKNIPAQPISQSAVEPKNPFFTTSNNQNSSNYVSEASQAPQISLATDKPILKTIPSLPVETTETQAVEEPAQPSLISNPVNPFTALKPSVISSTFAILIISLLIMPLVFLTNYVKNNQNAASLGIKYYNVPVAQSAELFQKIASVFSPTLSHRFFGTYPAGSPPGSQLAKNTSIHDQLASGRVSGDYKGVSISASKGQVLQASTGPENFLQINLDTELNGNFAVDGEGFFTGNVTAPNLVYGITAGENIEISGDPQNPTISATGLESTDTLQDVTARGATTTIASTFSGGLTASSINLTGALNFGQLSSDPSDAVNGASYYNTTSNQFRCYISGSWTNCDNVGGSGNGDITEVTAGAGLSGGGDADSVSLAINVQAGGGLEVSASGLSLLRSCGAGELLKWDGSSWVCDTDDSGAASAIINLQEESVAVGSDVDTINFAGNDFTLSTSLPGTNSAPYVTIDYANSGITRAGQTQTITAAWNFSTTPTFSNLSDGVLFVSGGNGTISTETSLDETRGGTGQTTYSTGDILYASGPNTLARLPIGENGYILSVSGAGTPTWTVSTGGTCPTCVVISPTASQVITPTGADTTGLAIEQTSDGSPTADIFYVSNSGGSTKYFQVDSTGVTTLRTPGASDAISVLTGNFKVGDGTSTQTLNGEDAYIEGLLEIDGILYAGSGTEALTVASGKIDADAIALITSDGTGATSSGSGLEVDTDRIGLLQGCSNGQVLKWNDGTGVWACSNDTGAASAVVNIEEEGTPIGTDVDTLNFAGNDFRITTPDTSSTVYIEADPDTFGNSASTFNLVDTTGTKTIDIGGVTSDATNTINIATNGTTNADTITIGNNNSSTTLSLTGGDDWSISAAGNATFNGNVILGNAGTDTLAINSTITSTSLVFEGSSNDGNDLSLVVTNPTDARTITLPDNSGTVAVAADGPIVLDADGVISCPTCAISGGSGGSLFTDGGATTYLTSQSDNLAIGGDDNTASFFVDVANGGNIIVNSSSTGASAATFNFTQTDDSDASDTAAGLTISGTSSSGDADNFYGINIAAITGGSASETAINIGSGWDNILNTDSITISGSGEIAGATGITSSGTITFSDLTPDRAVFVTTGGELTTSGDSADLAASLSNETGSGVVVFGTSPNFTTSVTTGSTSFDVFNTNATTVNAFGAATTLTIGANNSGTATIRNSTVNLSNGALQTAGTTRLSNAGALSNITGFTQTSGAFSSTLTTTNAAIFASSTTGSDTLSLLPQSTSTDNSFGGIITSDDLTDDRTWTFPDATGTVCLDTGNCAGAGDGVTASGTQSANQIAYFTGDDTLAGNDDFTWNNSTKAFSVNGTAAFNGVNAAGGSANSVTLSGTLGAFNGSDTFRGLYLNYTNANHTGATNVFNGIDIAGITGDAQATENAINIGAGWDNILNTGSITISGTGAIAGATGIASSGTITFSGLDASSFVVTDASSNLTTSADAADSSALASILSDETGTGLAVFGTSPTFSTSVVTDSSSFDVFNTNATTVNAFGAATTLTIGANNSGTATIRNSTVNLSNGALQTAGTTRLSNAGALSNITGFTQTSGAFSSTLTTTNAAIFASSTANSDRLRLLPQSTSTDATFNGTITSVDLTDSDKTWTFQNASGIVPLGTAGNSLFFTTTGDTALTLPESGTLLSDATTLFTVSGDTGDDQDITSGETLEVTGGTGIDTETSDTDTLTINFDSTEIGTTTWGSGSSIAWTFDAGTTDPILTFASDSVTLTAAATFSSSADFTVTNTTPSIFLTDTTSASDDDFSLNVNNSTFTIRSEFDSADYLIIDGDGVTTLPSLLNANGGIAVDTNNFTVSGTTGATAIVGALTTGNAFSISFDSATQTGALTGALVDFGNITSDGTNAVYGLRVADLGTASASTEYAIYQSGTDWDYGLYIEDAGLFDTTLQVNGNTTLGNAATDSVSVTGSIAQTYSPAGTVGTATANTISNTFSLNATDQTLTGLRIAMDTNSNDDTGDIYYGINIDSITSSSADEYALRIGSGFDNEILFEKGTNDLKLAVTAPSAAATITIPELSGDDEFCIKSLANCFGSGSGGVSAPSTQTAGQIAFFTGDDEIGGNDDFTWNNSTKAFAVEGTSSITLSAVSGSASSISLTQSDDGDGSDVSNALNIALTSSSGDADELNAINIANITGGSATETAIKIGSGFDNDIYFEKGTNDVIFRVEDPTQSIVVTLPDVDASSAEICLSTGNCLGGGGGGVSYTSQTTNALTKFSSNPGEITSSSVIDDGTTFDINNGKFVVTEASGNTEIDGTLTVNGGTFDVSAAATNISIADNTASAFTIAQGANTYFGITTTNDSESLTLDLPAGGGTSLTANLFTSNLAKTINLGTGTAADTINIGTGATTANTVNIATGAVANTITIGSASSTGVSITDNDWSINTSGVITTTGLANLNGGIAVDSTNFTVDGSTGAVATASTITAATTGTINGLNINSGALSGVTGYSQTAGNFAYSNGSGNFSIDSSAFDVTTAGAVSGVTTLSLSGNISDTDSAVTIADSFLVTDGTDSLSVSASGDITFVDADGGASITGPAGGALTITGTNGLTLNTSSDTDITFAPNGEGDIVFTVDSDADSFINITGLGAGTGSALCVDGSNNLVTCTVGSGGLSGSGADKQIAFFDSTSNVISESDFGWDYDTNQLTIVGLSAATTATTASISSSSNTLTSGGLFSSALTSSALTAAFTGGVGSFSSDRTYTGDSTISDTGNILNLSRASTVNNASGTYNVTGAILNITNSATETDGTLGDSANLVAITQDADATGALLYLNANRSSTANTILIEQSAGGTDIFRLQDNGNLTINGALVAATDETVNGLDINSGAISDVTGYSQTAGNFAYSNGSGNFSIDSSAFDVTTAGAVSGVTTLSLSGAISDTDSEVSINDALNVVNNFSVATNKFTVDSADGATVIAGTAKGTDALTITAGDMTLTDGDLTITAGDLNIGLDADDEVDITKTAANSSTEEGIDLTFTAGAGNGNDVYSGFRIAATSANHSASSDKLYGINIANLSSADDEGEETAIFVGTGWDNILSYNGTPIINGSGQIVAGQITGDLFSITDGDTQEGVAQGEEITFADGTDTTAVVSADRTVTINNTSTLATVTGRGASTTDLVNLDGGIAVDSTNFTVDGSTGAVSTASTIAAAGLASLNGGIAVDTNNFTVSGTTGATAIVGALTTGNAFSISFDSATQTGALTGALVDFGNITSDGTNAVYGLRVADLGTASASTEYAIYQSGTDWDYGLYIEDAAHFNTTLEVYGNTIGLNNDADADNLLGVSAAGGAAGSDLYWGNQILCDVSEADCGWATSASSPWTTVSNVVQLTTTTDDVNIGGTTSLAKLGVEGDSDEIQFLVRGHSTQTENLVVFQDSDENDLFTLDNAGAATFAGTITAATTGTINGLNINSGALSGVTGYSQTAGNFAYSNGSGNFSIDSSAFDVTTAGAVSGVTTLSLSGAISDTDSDVTISDDLTVSGTTGLTLSGTGGQITFANGETIDNDTNNQINLGLGASGTLLLTSTTTASITNSAGALGINAQATALNLQADGSIDVNIAGGSASTGCTITNSNGNLACSGTITQNGVAVATGTGTDNVLPKWNGTSGALEDSLLTDDGTTLTYSGTGGLTLSGANSDLTFANGEAINNDSDGTLAFTIGGTSGLNVGATGITSIGNVAHSIVNSSGALNIDSNSTGAINIGTSANAKTLTFGNASVASQFAFNTGATTQTAFALNTDSITSGKAFDISLDSNSLTSGIGLNISSTSTSTSFSGSLVNLDWSAAGSITNSADLFKINIGSGDFANSFINLTDNGSSVFSVSQTQFTTSLPSNFTSAGDVSIANDLQFTNPTASFIKSYSALNLVAGDTFSSSNLVLQTYNEGSVYIPSGAATANAVEISAPDLTTGTGILVSLTEGTLNGGYYFRAFDTTGGTDVFTIAEDGTTEIGGQLALSGSEISFNSDDITLTYSSNALAFDGGALNFADSTLLDLSAINASSTTEGLILPQNASACASAIAEGQICWDTNGEDLYVGNGTTAIQINSTAGTTTTLQQAYEAGETIDIDSTNGALAISLVSDNFDISVGESSNTGDFRIWDGTSNWLLVDESADTMTIGSAAGSGLTLDTDTTVSNGMDFLAGQTTGKIGFGGAVSGSDYLFNITGDNTQDWSRLINITQSNDAAENSYALYITSNAAPGSVTGVRSVYGSNIEVNPTATVTSPSIQGIIRTYGTNQTIDLSGITLSDTTNDTITAETWGNAVNISGGITLDDSNGSDIHVIKTYGQYANVAPTLDLESVGTAQFNTYGGFFQATPSSGGDASLSSTTYGIYALSGGNLTTTGTTAHYGGYFTASGTADTNYGIYTTASGATDNNYALYVAAGSSTFANGVLVDLSAIDNEDSGEGLKLPQNDIANMVDPGAAGFIAYDTDGNAPVYWDGSAWTNFSGSVTNWNDIGDATALGSIDFQGFDQDIVSAEANGDILTITNTTTDQASDATILRLASNDTNDANTIFIAGTNDMDGTPVNDWLVASTGTAGGLTQTLGASGVRLTTDGDGALTFLGLGDGNNEDLTLNLDDTANTAVFSSSTGVTTFSLSGMDLSVGGGDILGANGESIDIGEAADGTISLLVDGTSGLNVGATGITSIGNVAHSIVNSSGALNIDSNSTGAINIGTGSNAKAITIGNNTGASSLNFYSGTGSQGFNSSVQTTTGVNGSWVFTNSALTSGTGAYFNSNSITTGKLVDIAGFTTQTSGTLLNVTSTSTALAGTTTTGNGLLGNLSWTPGSSTIGTGDLFRLHIGADGSLSSGSIFNIVDGSTSIFSVKETAFETSLPTSFTAAGDVSIAYDINFTNPTASYIKSAAPMYLVSGETFNSSDLTLATYNSGNVVLDPGPTGSITLEGATNFGSLKTLANDATPDVSGGSWFVTGGTTTITDFDAGSGTLKDGHIIFIKAAHSVTITCTGTEIDCGAANIALTDNDLISFIYDAGEDIWWLINWFDDTDTQSGGADLAEWYASTESLEEGDVVSINPNENVKINKSNGSYDNKAMGIISTQPGLILGSNTGVNSYKVALQGRVPTKVSTENGPILRGDSLTSSSIPGVAMKATKPGQIIGKALEPYNGSGVGKIEVFVNVSYADPGYKVASVFETEGNFKVDLTSNGTMAVNNGSSNVFRVEGNGNVILGGGNLTTSSTSGFAYISSINGTPTGAPADMSGLTAITYDKATNRICAYNAGWNCIGSEDNDAAAALTLDSEGALVLPDTKATKITVSGDVKIGGLASASNFALDAGTINMTGALANLPVNAEGKVTLADIVNDLNAQTTANTNALVDVQSSLASSSAELAEAKILGEQAVQHALTLDDKIASTSSSLSSLSDRINDLLASISGDTTPATTSATPESNEIEGLTGPEVLFATESANLANLNVTENLSTLNLSAIDATVSATFKSLGETFLGQTTIAGDLTVDGTLSFTEGSKINALPVLYFQTNPLAQAVDFFNGLVTISKDGVLAAKEIITDQIKVTANKSAGEVIIPAGEIEVPVLNELVKADSIIILTSETPGAPNLAVSAKVEGAGFITTLNGVYTEDVKFNYLIVGQQEASN